MSSQNTTIYHMVSQALSDRILTPEIESAIGLALAERTYISTRDYLALERLMIATSSGLVQKTCYQAQAA